MTSCVVESTVAVANAWPNVSTNVLCLYQCAILLQNCSMFQINAEFKRITTMPLQSRFLSQLDQHTANLLKIFEKRSGQQGQKLKDMSAMVTVRILT